MLFIYRFSLFSLTAYWLGASLTEPAWAVLMALWAAIFLVPIGAKQSVAHSNFFEIDSDLLALQPVASTLLAGSFLLEKGAVAGLLAVFYLLWCIAVLLPNILKIKLKLPTFTLLAAWGFLTNAAVWLVFDRLGYQPLGFSAWIVLLTGAHFHYAGFALTLTIALLLHTNPTNKAAEIAAYGILGGVVLTALGITTTQLGLPHWIETLSGASMSLSALVTGLVFIRESTREAGSTRWLWLAGSLCLCGTMVMALLYALRPVFPLEWLGLPFMQAVHGTINALGFGTLILLGWQRKGLGSN
jgi:YndJ-like protein